MINELSSSKGLEVCVGKVKYVLFPDGYKVTIAINIEYICYVILTNWPISL